MAFLVRNSTVIKKCKLFQNLYHKVVSLSQTSFTITHSTTNKTNMFQYRHIPAHGSGSFFILNTKSGVFERIDVSRKRITTSKKIQTTTTMITLYSVNVEI